MRKVLSFVLVLSLVLGSFGMAFAAPLSDIAGKDCEEAVNVLTELGVVQGYPDGSFKPEKVVTRAEMAVIVVSALGLEDYAVGTAKFSDMAGHWSNGYVAYAASLGIIAGYPDGTFKPDAIVSYDEAATMLVAALGYTADSLIGTWPANYVSKAKTLGILDGIKSGAAGANRGDIAIMAFQTLDQTIGKTNKDGDFVFDKDNPDTMLVRLGAELYDPDGEALKAGAAFVLTDDIADDAVANVKAYLGAYVTAYANDENEIIAIKEVKSVFLTGKFTDTEATTVGALANDDEFKAGDTEYTVNFVTDPKTPVAFVNADSSKSITVDEDKEYTIAAKVSGTKIKEIYSVHEWVVSEDDQVTDADLAKIDAKTPTLLTSKFALDDSDKIDTNSFDLVGAAKLADIQEDDIVYVYEKGKNGDIVKIVVGTEVVTGEVTKIKGSTYTIGGKDYKLADAVGVESSADTYPAVEDEITAYLDGFGKIYDYEATTKASNYAIVLATKNGVKAASGQLGGTTAQVKLFLADGTTKTFDVDTDKYANISKAGIATYAALALDWQIVSGDVVKYGVNKDGEINALTLVVDSSTSNETNVDTATYVAANAKISSTGYFDGLKISSDALILTHDSFSASKDDYGTTTLAKVLKTTVGSKAWYVSNDSGVITFLYLPASTSSDDKVYGVLTDTEENNSSAGYGVDLLVDGKAVFYNSEDFSSKAFSNLYEVKFAADGTVSDLVETTVASITVDSVYRNVIKDSTKSYSLASNVVIYVWNATDKVYEVGSTSDIDEGDKIYLFDVYGDSDGAYDIVLTGYNPK